MNTEQEQFIQKCKAEGFDDDQMDQICNGFFNHLTTEQIKVYAKREFDYQQMREIRAGFTQVLTLEQVRLFARPEFGWSQMYKIRLMLIYEPYKKVKTKVALMLLES